MSNVALIAHDRNKNAMVELATEHRETLRLHSLFATASTGTRLMEETGLDVFRFRSGPLGGDQQIGAMVALDELDLVIFLRDPLASHPHGSDVDALLRLCDVQGIPAATNISTAELILRSLAQEGFGWRNLVDRYLAKGVTADASPGTTLDGIRDSSGNGVMRNLPGSMRPIA